jgi:hypothetical protein
MNAIGRSDGPSDDADTGPLASSSAAPVTSRPRAPRLPGHTSTSHGVSRSRSSICSRSTDTAIDSNSSSIVACASMSSSTTLISSAGVWSISAMCTSGSRSATSRRASPLVADAAAAAPRISSHSSREST